jgi:hypothetical protein
MTIDFDLNKLTERGRMLLLMKSNEWGCTPGEALARLLEAAAKKAKLPTDPENGNKAA